MSLDIKLRELENEAKNYLKNISIDSINKDYKENKFSSKKTYGTANIYLNLLYAIQNYQKNTSFYQEVEELMLKKGKIDQKKYAKKWGDLPTIQENMEHKYFINIVSHLNKSSKFVSASIPEITIQKIREAGAEYLKNDKKIRELENEKYKKIALSDEDPEQVENWFNEEISKLNIKTEPLAETVFSDLEEKVKESLSQAFSITGYINYCLNSIDIVDKYCDKLTEETSNNNYKFASNYANKIDEFSKIKKFPEVILGDELRKKFPNFYK
jgi:Holliday junction resolvase-like predicted endonuclease